MNNKIIVRFTNEDIPYQERLDLLVNERCGAILPMSILHRGTNIIGYYDISGYNRLSQCDQLDGMAILTIVEKIICTIEEGIQYLLDPDEYVLNTNTLYIDSNYTNIKIAFVPDNSNVCICKKFKDILTQLQDIATDEGKTCLSIYIKRIEKKNLSYLGLRRLINIISQEINCTL